MNNLMKFGFFALLSVLLVTTACEDDDPIDNTEGPSATIDFGQDYENQTWEPGRLLGPITITFTAGDNELNGVYVYRNGDVISTAEFLVDNEEKAANPFNLEEGQKQEVTFDFSIELSDAEVTDTYRFEVSDTEQNTEAVSLDITTEKQGTPVEVDSLYLVWNADGQEPGGLDLDAEPSAASVSRDSPEAEIMDSGIDGTGNPENWLQTIAPVNGSVLMPFSGDFASITTKEQIVENFNAELSVETSNEVNEGDAFIVKRDDNYYIIQATDVVEITSTGTDANDDYYEFAVKK